MTKLVKTRLVALALGFAIGLLPGSASADQTTTVYCGEAITHSIRVANDLTDCPGDGLVIGADASRSTSTVTRSTA